MIDPIYWCLNWCFFKSKRGMYTYSVYHTYIYTRLRIHLETSCGVDCPASVCEAPATRMITTSSFGRHRTGNFRWHWQINSRTTEQNCSTCGWIVIRIGKKLSYKWKGLMKPETKPPKVGVPFRARNCAKDSRMMPNSNHLWRRDNPKAYTMKMKISPGMLMKLSSFRYWIYFGENVSS